MTQMGSEGQGRWQGALELHQCVSRVEPGTFSKILFLFTLLLLIVYSCHTTILISNDDNSTRDASDVSRVLVNIFIFIFTITLLMILLLIDFLHDDNHHLNATITPNDNNSTRDVSDAIINTIVN